MRKFSELEKNIINTMIQIHQTGDVLNVMNNIFESTKALQSPSGFYLCVGPEQGYAGFFIELNAAKSLDFTKKETQAFKLVASVVTLFQFLEERAFITLTNSNFDKSKPYYIGENPPHQTSRFDGIDYEYQADLYRFVTSRIFVSEELITFVDQGYKTDEEIAHSREIDLLKKQLSL